MQTDKLVTLKSAAVQLGKTMGGMRSWVIRRQIDFVKIGNRVMVKQSTIDEIIERGTVKALAPKAVSLRLKEAA